jgi:Family of unknown function (DUF6496)
VNNITPIATPAPHIPNGIFEGIEKNRTSHRASGGAGGIVTRRTASHGMWRARNSGGADDAAHRCEIHNAIIVIVDSSRAGLGKAKGPTQEEIVSTELPEGIGVFADPKGGENKWLDIPKSASRDVKGAMERRKAGALKSGKSGKTVKSKKLAIAIGLLKARARGKKVPSKKSA